MKKILIVLFLFLVSTVSCVKESNYAEFSSYLASPDLYKPLIINNTEFYPLCDCLFKDSIRVEQYDKFHKEGYISSVKRFSLYKDRNNKVYFLLPTGSLYEGIPLVKINGRDILMKRENLVYILYDFSHASDEEYNSVTDCISEIVSFVANI